MTFSIKVNINGENAPETPWIEGLEREKMEYMVSSFISTGYMHKIDSQLSVFFPVHRISSVEVRESILLT